MTSTTPDDKPEAAGCGNCGGSADNPGWYRYSATGEMLGSTSYDYWWYLYHDPDILGMPKGTLTARKDGFFLFKDNTTGALLSVYDWDGTQLETELPAKRATHHFHHLTTNRLKSYYRVQQQANSGGAA